MSSSRLAVQVEKQKAGSIFTPRAPRQHRSAQRVGVVSARAADRRHPIARSCFAPAKRDMVVVGVVAVARGVSLESRRQRWTWAWTWTWNAARRLQSDIKHPAARNPSPSCMHLICHVMLSASSMPRRDVATEFAAASHVRPGAANQRLAPQNQAQPLLISRTCSLPAPRIGTFILHLARVLAASGQIRFDLLPSAAAYFWGHFILVGWYNLSGYQLPCFQRQPGLLCAGNPLQTFHQRPR
ncbi:hypothetical protein BKA66DRAFT_547872 [Pyrenochaeta sp. MPI-SDFR-AT-0127]|nr:hypothetical protein BKA66DRAFT_547872 [Pyrenochaeta sp. MPI-SDFR-AT-0127]